MISHDRHCNADQLRMRVTWLPWQKQLEGAQLESAIKPCKAGRQMNPRAGLKRAQKLPLTEQILPPATQPRLQDRLRLSALQASMPRNAQLHKARSRICRHSICERMGFASTCRTEPCWQFHVAADQAVATALVSCSASNFSILQHPWAQDPSHVLAAAGFMQCLVPRRWQAQHRRTPQGRKADESKSRLEEGSEASIG